MLEYFQEEKGKRTSFSNRDEPPSILILRPAITAQIDADPPSFFAINFFSGSGICNKPLACPCFARGGGLRPLPGVHIVRKSI